MAWERRPPKQPDPRSTRRYRTVKAAWLPLHHGQRCALCPLPVDLYATGAAKATVEHLVPIRDLRRQAASWAELVDLCCDTDHWAIAHQGCQSKQGARVGGLLATGNRTTIPEPPPRPRPSRDW